MEQLATYLNLLFSSAHLCYQNWLQESLNFHEDVKCLLQNLARNRLDALYAVTKKPSITDPALLQHKNGIMNKFHTAYVVSRPVFPYHWAIKFEANFQLMTIQFYEISRWNNANVVKTDILANTTLHRRVFWYWWENLKNRERSHFTTPWKCINTIYLGTIDPPLIGKLICEWLRMNGHGKSIHANSQHFVRDLVSVFDFKLATKLIASMDRDVHSAIIPAAVYDQDQHEYERTERVCKSLMKIVTKYKAETQNKKPNLSSDFR
eukprot:355748_1